MQPGPYPPGPYQPGYPPAPPPQKKGMSTGCIVALVVLPLVSICFLGMMAAVAIPAFTRYTKRSKTSEATGNIAVIYEGAATYAVRNGRVPPSAPRTPAQTPRAIRVADPPGSWDQPGWQAISFSLSSPHYYSYEYINNGTSFTVRAYGDLDGDGIESTFERTGTLSSTGEVLGGLLQITNELE